MRARDASIDIVRGVAIILIVVGHVLRGLANASVFPSDAPLFLTADRGVYMVHLALFAFAAGLMVPGSLSSRTPGKYLRRRLVEFAWIYIVWSLIQGLMQYALAGSVNTERSLVSVFTLWKPTNQMWFIPWIALMSACAAIIQPWRTRGRTAATLVGAGTLSAAMWGVFGPFIFAQGLGLTIFYAVGACMGLAGYAAVRGRLGLVAMLALAVASLAASIAIIVATVPSAPTTSQVDRTVQSVILGLTAAWLAVIGIVAASILVESFVPLARPLAYCGRQSMVIFLAHTMTLAATRILLLRLHIDSAPVHIVLGIVGGVIGAIVLHWATRRFLPWLWAAPRALHRALGATARPQRR